MNFTECVLIRGCWNIGPVLCVKWIYLNIMDLLWVVHMKFITSMHMWFYFLVTHFSHSEHCYGRGERSVLFNDVVNFWDYIVSMGDECNEYGALIKRILTGENRSTWGKPVLVPLFSTTNLTQTGLEFLCLKRVNLWNDTSSLQNKMILCNLLDKCSRILMFVINCHW